MTLVLLAGLSAGVLQDTSGKVIPNRQVNVYLRGTSTPASVFADSAGSSPMTQPVTTDSSGQVPGYVAGSVSVDIVDVLTGLREQGEPVFASGVAVTKEAPINITHPDFGASPNASASTNDAAIAAAVAYAKTGGAIGRVFVPRGLFKTSARIQGGSQSGLSFSGDNQGGSFIQQQTDGEPIFEWSATTYTQYGGISNLRLEHLNQQTTASNPNAAAISMTNTNANGFAYFIFRDLLFNKSCYMLNMGGTTPFWGSHIENWFGGNISGSLIAQASPNNPVNKCIGLKHVGAAVVPTGYALSLGGEWDMDAIDIEDWTDGLLNTAFTDSRIHISSMHIERHKLATNGFATVRISNSQFSFDNWYGAYQLNNTGAYYLFNVDTNARVRMGTIESSKDAASTGTGTLRHFNFTDATCQIQLGPRQSNSGNIVDYLVSESGILKSVLSDRGLPPTWDSSVALPTASSTYRGRQFYVKGTNTSTADQLVMCQQSDQNTYSWTPVETSVRSGTATLVAGTSGSIADTKITAGSLVRLTNVGAGGTLGVPSVALVAATGFTINSSNAADTSKIFWEIVSY